MDQATRRAGWRPADMAFLAMALMVHAALLVLPLKAWKTATPELPPRLRVDLRQLPQPSAFEPPPAEQPPPDEAEPANVAGEQPEPLVEQRRSARIALEELPEHPPETPPQPVETEIPNARQLRELVRRAEIPAESESPTRQLGEAKPWQPPANWNKNAGAPYPAEFDNRFNGMTVPDDVEIVDRWQAADGSHNVVLNLPNGDTVCGRAEAYNPMQPLVEPIMMFRPCGGGGKRTFSMPDRYNKGR